MDEWKDGRTDRWTAVSVPARTFHMKNHTQGQGGVATLENSRKPLGLVRGQRVKSEERGAAAGEGQGRGLGALRPVDRAAAPGNEGHVCLPEIYHNQRALLISEKPLTGFICSFEESLPCTPAWWSCFLWAVLHAAPPFCPLPLTGQEGRGSLGCVACLVERPHKPWTLCPSPALGTLGPRARHEASWVPGDSPRCCSRQGMDSSHGPSPAESLPRLTGQESEGTHCLLGPAPGAGWQSGPGSVTVGGDKDCSGHKAGAGAGPRGQSRTGGSCWARGWGAAAGAPSKEGQDAGAR